MERPPIYEKLLAFFPDSMTRDEAFWQDLLASTSLVRVKKGDCLIRVGEMCQDAYFIGKGLLMTQYVNENGNECVTGFSSDSMFPFVSTIGYLTNTSSEFEVKALEASELLCFSKKDIERLSLSYPAFATEYQNVMLTIIFKFYSMFAVRQTSSTEEFLRYLYTRHRWIVDRVPDKYIAQYMGITNSWYCKLKRALLQ